MSNIELTKDDEKLLDTVAEEYLALLHRGDEVDLEKIKAPLEMIYGFYNMPLPPIHVADGMEEAIKKAKELGEPNPRFDWVGISDASWVARYDASFRLDKGILSAEEFKDTAKIKDLIFGGVWDTVLLDGQAIVIRFPAGVHTNAAGDLHNPKGPAIYWRNGEAEYAWNGVFVPKKLIEAPETYDTSEVLALPTEQRRAFCERLGWGPALDKLGCKLVDSWTDSNTNLAYELYKGGDFAILKKQSPALQDGSQPWYAEPVHNDLRTAQAARKWQAVCRPGKDPAAVAEDCNENPVLKYKFEA